MDWLIEILLQRMLQCRPSISRTGNMLVARSGWKTQLLCLGFAGRKVTVDPDRKILRITQRLLWFVNFGHVYTFERILYVLSGYSDWSLSGISLSGAYRDRGIYTVELRLTTGERVVLFRFFSEGDFVNDGIFPDVFYWSDYLDAAITKGDQGTQAERYARLVAGLLGVAIHSD
ncbi:MAG: hypothetical protein ACYC96_04665 [Fimbriimonadaceae bacterium]